MAPTALEVGMVFDQGRMSKDSVWKRLSLGSR